MLPRSGLSARVRSSFRSDVSSVRVSRTGILNSSEGTLTVKRTFDEMISLPLDRYSFLGDDWTVEDRKFTAPPLVEGRDEQLLIFGDRLRNGSLTADISILDSRNRGNGEPFNEAALMTASEQSSPFSWHPPNRLHSRRSGSY
jgi:hypothetical protein